MTIRLLVFDDEVLSCSKSGTIWGRVYFDLGDEDFPGRGWSDMVVAFVAAWQSALVQLARLDKHKERVYFMDGPYAIDVTLCGEGTVTLDFIHDDATKDSRKTRIDALLRNAVSVSDQLLSICKVRGWLDGNDIHELIVTRQQGVEILATLASNMQH
jgi:hypothetical protein